MIVVRLYENEVEQQQTVLKEILCREVLGMTADEFEASKGSIEEDITLSPDAIRFVIFATF